MLSKSEQLHKKKTLKQKKCKFCDKLFTPLNQKHICCDWRCSVDYVKVKEEKRKKSVHRKAIQVFKDGDIPHLTKVAQQVFNKYIRKRDKGNPCCACGHIGNRQAHASHYRSVGGNSKHRFNEMNVHVSCSICNQHKSGNLVPYRVFMIDKYGEGEVLKLEEDNSIHKYSVDELQGIIKTYKAKYKELPTTQRR